MRNENNMHSTDNDVIKRMLMKVWRMLFCDESNFDNQLVHVVDFGVLEESDKEFKIISMINKNYLLYKIN